VSHTGPKFDPAAFSLNSEFEDLIPELFVAVVHLPALRGNCFESFFEGRVHLLAGVFIGEPIVHPCLYEKTLEPELDFGSADVTGRNVRPSAMGLWSNTVGGPGSHGRNGAASGVGFHC
jgi:hypothetical protein